MIEAIEKLFIDYDFQHTDINGSRLFSRKESDAKQEFWLVIKTDNPDVLLDEQASLFTSAKRSQLAPALDKNISLLVLWETEGDLNHQELKKRLMLLEENASFFKKYVLYYSKSEFEVLNTALQGSPLKSFLKSNITSQEIFDLYKEDQKDQSTWYPLLYRIAIKLPFITVDAGKTEKLASLIEDNEIAIEKSKIEGLASFNSSFFKLNFDHLLNSEANPENLLDALIGDSNEG